MSGHSKWHSIKHKKGITDAKRGKIFTKHAKLITISAKSGGDPDLNPSLRLAIDNAKKDNTPNENILRAIKKGTGEDKDGTVIEEITYEAIGPAGTALLIECLTDNKNRTFTNLRTTLNKKGGNIGSSGSVAWMFERKGVIFVTKNKTEEELEMIAIDAGADDIEMEDEQMIVYTKFEDFMHVKHALEQQGLKIENATLKQIPKNTVAITNKEDAQKIFTLIDAIEDDDDISEVYGNFDIPEEFME